jgi:hypothetical protein
MTSPAVFFGRPHVRNVGEIDAIRLSRIDEPWDLFSRCDVFLGKLFLFRFFPECGLRIVVAHDARFELGNANKRAVLSKAVAKETSLPGWAGAVWNRGEPERRTIRSPRRE